MKWWFKPILAVLVGGELVLCAVFGNRVYINVKQRKDVLGAQYVTRISKTSVVFPRDNDLKFYYEPKPNSSSSAHPDWLSYTTTYTYNADGIRATKDYTDQKSPDVFRIIALGDSFTEGQYVNISDVYTTVLEHLLNQYANTCSSGKKFEIINLGVIGYDVTYAVERYRRHGIQYNPDLVVWLINEHNVLMLSDLLYPLQQKIENETSAAARLQHERERNYYYASDIARKQLVAQYSQDYIFSLQRQALNTFSSFYRGPLLIAMFQGASSATKEVVASFVNDRKNSYFDDSLTQLSREEGTELPDYHPSISGHTIIANQLFQYLKDKQLIPCLSILRQ
jgi:hypothetical protein